MRQSDWMGALTRQFARQSGKDFVRRLDSSELEACMIDGTEQYSRTERRTLDPFPRERSYAMVIYRETSPLKPAKASINMVKSKR